MNEIKKVLNSIVLTTIIALTFAEYAQAQNISLTVTGIKSKKGQIIVSVFKDNESFHIEKPLATYLFSKAAMQNGTITIPLALQAGIYGIAMLDDENSDGKMGKNILKIPKEGFGFSNYYLSGMSKPSFDDFKFEVKNTPLKIQSRIRYM